MKLLKQLLPGSLTFFVFFYAFVLIFVDKQAEDIKNSRIQFYTESEQSEIHHQKLQNTIGSFNEDQIQQIVANPQEKKELVEYISYKLPEGWIEEYEIRRGYIYLKSDDFESGYVYTKGLKGIYISIHKSTTSDDYTYDDMRRHQETYGLGTTKIIDEILIDGNKTLLSFHSYEGTHVNYDLLVHDDYWRISIGCEQCNTLQEYITSNQKRIVDEFIKSIKFHYD